MPAPADPLHFDAAIEWFRARVPLTQAQQERLEKEKARRAFTVAGAAQLDLVTDVWLAIDRAIAEGTTLEDFQKEIGPDLEEAWGGEDPWHLETIFRTNVQLAYSAGRWQQQTDPAVMRIRPFWRYSVILDGRTSEICEELADTVLPADDAFWEEHNPPCHFNAVAAHVRVLTARGLVAARDVRAGDLVWTHKARWRKATATALRRSSGARVRVIEIAPGRRLTITNEHPVLVHTPAGALEWRKGGDLQVGDQILQHVDPGCGIEGGRARDANNAPILLDKPSVPRQIVRGPIGAPMPLAVDFQVDPLRRKGQIQDVGPDNVLGQGATAEQREQVLFARGEFLTQGGRLAIACAGLHPGHMHRVTSAHALSDGGALAPPRPMPFARPLGNNPGQPARDFHLLALAAHGDSKARRPVTERCFTNPDASLDTAQTLPLAPMPGCDKVSNKGFGQFHLVTITSIVDKTYSGDLCDISVADDESYTANGIIVHNCRSTIIALTEEQAGEPDESGPAIDAQDGFGNAPGEDDWTPDLRDYPAPLRAIFADKSGD